MLDKNLILKRYSRIPETLVGQRVDVVLAQLFPEYSRANLARWVKAQQILLNNAPARPRDRVQGGELVELQLEDKPAIADQPQAISLDLLYEDADVIVLNKPIDLVVHPGAGVPDGTLVNGLLHWDRQLAALPRAGIVHRLDKQTSGVMVVARTLTAYHALTQQLSARTVQREYLAIVQGVLIAGGTVDAPLGRHPRDRLRMAVHLKGRPAVTHYRVRERFHAHTAVNCQLETGRTHQIRVHLSHIRHPIVGDPIYGGPLRLPRHSTPELTSALRGFRHQALHAYRLTFLHPKTGQPISCEAPLPEDLTTLLSLLRGHAQLCSMRK